jgi:hypothetical protein
MENGNSKKRKLKETQRNAKQRASQTPDKIQERRAADSQKFHTCCTF